MLHSIVMKIQQQTDRLSYNSKNQYNMCQYEFAVVEENSATSLFLGYHSRSAIFIPSGLG